MPAVRRSDTRYALVQRREFFVVFTKPKLRGVTATETNADLGERFSA
jgi:hypothetical protein